MSTYICIFDSTAPCFALTLRESRTGRMSQPAESSSLVPESEEMKAWIKQQLNAELERIKAAGSMAIPLPVKNTSIVREQKKVYNRVEVDTGFDFDQIVQVMVSDSVACPMKPNHSYCHVLLFKDMQKPPLILSYIYQNNKANKLVDWILINSQLKRTVLQVKYYK